MKKRKQKRIVIIVFALSLMIISGIIFYKYYIHNRYAWMATERIFKQFDNMGIDYSKYGQDKEITDRIKEDFHVSLTEGDWALKSHKRYNFVDTHNWWTPYLVTTETILELQGYEYQEENPRNDLISLQLLKTYIYNNNLSIWQLLNKSLMSNWPPVKPSSYLDDVIYYHSLLDKCNLEGGQDIFERED